MYKSQYELNVLVSGKPVKEYFHKNRFWVEAKQGGEYTIRLKNHSPKRILAIFSVDGIDTLKGGEAAKAEGGYIVNAFSSLTVQGYRIDDNSVASFKFEESTKSYASLVENDMNAAQAESTPSKNNGVIGVRIYEEKETKYVPAWKDEDAFTYKPNFYEPDWTRPHNSPYHWFTTTPVASGMLSASFSTGCFNPTVTYRPSIKRRCADFGGNTMGLIQSRSFTPAPSSDMEPVNCFSASVPEGFDSVFSSTPVSTPNFSLGTSWGKQVEDKVIKTTFQKAESFIDLEVFYLNRDELRRIGIDLENAKKVFTSGMPEAFGKKEEYCKIPANWGGAK